jgi:hypothetical protein
MTCAVRMANYRAEIQAADYARAICVSRGRLRCGRIADASATLEKALPELNRLLSMAATPPISPPQGAA